MDVVLLVVIAYVAFGIWLLRFSVKLAQRCIPSHFRRAAICGGVFAVWFCPGILAGHDGAVPAPLWLMLLLQGSAYLTNARAMFYIVAWLSFFWGIGGVMIFSATGISRRFGSHGPSQSKHEPSQPKQTPKQILIRALVCFVLLAVVAYLRPHSLDPQLCIFAAITIIVITAINLVRARKREI